MKVSGDSENPRKQVLTTKLENKDDSIVNKGGTARERPLTTMGFSF
jgi:hypothetical protein